MLSAWLSHIFSHFAGTGYQVGQYYSYCVDDSVCCSRREYRVFQVLAIDETDAQLRVWAYPQHFNQRPSLFDANVVCQPKADVDTFGTGELHIPFALLPRMQVKQLPLSNQSRCCAQ